MIEHWRRRDTAMHDVRSSAQPFGKPCHVFMQGRREKVMCNKLEMQRTSIVDRGEYVSCRSRTPMLLGTPCMVADLTMTFDAREKN